MGGLWFLVCAELEEEPDASEAWKGDGAGSLDSETKPALEQLLAAKVAMTVSLLSPCQ